MKTTTAKRVQSSKFKGPKLQVREIAEQARQGRTRNQKPETGNSITILGPAWLSSMVDLERASNTVLTAGHTLAKFARDMKVGDLRPSAVTSNHIRKWINPVESEITLATRKSRLSFLRSFFRWYVTTHPGQADPTQDVHVSMKLLTHRQKEGQVTKTFTDPQITRILDKLGQIIDTGAAPEEFELRRPDLREWATFWFVATALGRYAGLRLSDVCLLERASVDDTPGKIVVWTRKRQVRVALPIKGKVLLDAIAMIPMPRTPEQKKYCFPQWREEWLDATRRCNLSVQYTRFLAALKIKGGLTYHSLRHSYATEAWKAGIHPAHIRRDLGHSSYATTQKYIHEEEP